MTEFECERRQRYRVVLEHGLLDSGRTELAEAIGPRSVLVITTPTVFRHHGRALLQSLQSWGIDAAVEVLPLSERTKTMDSVLEVCRFARLHGIGRRDVIVGFGGGVTTDVTSMAASLFRRGVPCVRLPTSLIGQVDAGVGLKSAVNDCEMKSALGCFEPPEAVLSDPSWLRTLAPRALRSGFAEIIKIAVVRDAALLGLVRADGPALVSSAFAAPVDAAEAMLRRSVELMLHELHGNPFERDLERVVDFGHTFSPALETSSEHRLTHGEAVAVDMALSTRIATRLGVLGGDDGEVIIDALRIVGLPTSSPYATPELLARAADEAVAHRGGSMNLVLPDGIGHASFLSDRVDLSDALLRSVAGESIPAGPEALFR